MYGTQTTGCEKRFPRQFEKDVKMYGTQTPERLGTWNRKFENDVEMYGTQTNICGDPLARCLRMM